MSATRKLTLKSCAVRGPAGKSAYEAAVEAGYEGTAAEYYAIIGGIPDGLAQAMEKAEHPAFPEDGSNAHVIPSLSTETDNVKVLYLNGHNPDGLPHTFTPVIRNVADPQLEGDAANKAYVDQQIAALKAELLGLRE